MKPIAELDDDEFQALARRALRELPDAPPAWQQAAMAAFTPAAAAGGVGAAFTALAQGVVQHIAAVLSFDSWAAPAAAAGLRSAAPAAAAAATRHLLFTAQGRDIDLRIAREPEGFSIAGQVLGPDEAGSVTLAEAGAGAPAAHSAALDAMGEFRIDGIRRGAWVLTLQFGSERIVLPPVEVGEPPR